MAQTKKNCCPFGYLIAVLLVGLFAGGIGGALVSDWMFDVGFQSFSGKYVSNEKTVEERVYVEESRLIEAREMVAPAVVSVVQLKEIRMVSAPSNFPFFFQFPGFEDPFFNPQPEAQPEDGEEPQKRVVGGGTGFIITEEGWVVTNKHVVIDETAEYHVILNDGTEYMAEVLSKDVFNDLAVLQIQAKEDESLPKLPTVKLGDSDKLQIGQRVLAIGNALAEYQNTTTAGIVSATGRQIVASDSFGRSRETLTGLIQTDAAINPGNSGGPLVNLNGEVIGINTAIESGAEGIGFAIPINDVKPIIASLEQYGRIVRPILGVRYIILTEEKAKELQLTGVTHGALLVGNPEQGEFAVIPGMPADKAGLQMADVILAIDGKDITVDYTLQDAIRNKQPEDEVTLKVWRSGEEMEVKVTLGRSGEE